MNNLTNGPLSKASENSQLFCLNLVYASACSMTVEAWQFMNKGPQTPQNQQDAKFYLDTLFSKPLEENV